MVDVTHYSFRVFWSEQDGEHVATVAEFPRVSWLAPTPDEALAGLTAALRDIVADMQTTGEPIPEPISHRAYSGRLNVRIPPDLHRRLTLAAAEENVSLNRFVSDRLARV